MLGSVDALKMIRGGNNRDSELEGIHILQATAAEPNPVKFKILGTELNVDAEMFDIPVSVYPICKGDTFLSYPLVSETHQRWAIVAKLNGSGKTGTMEGSDSCRVDGVAVSYSGSKIVSPKGARAGDRVVVTPYGRPDNVKYALTPIDYRIYWECGYYGNGH